MLVRVSDASSNNERLNARDRKGRNGRNDASFRVAIIIALVVLAFSAGVATPGWWLALVGR